MIDEIINTNEILNEATSIKKNTPLSIKEILRELVMLSILGVFFSVLIYIVLYSI